MMNDFIVYDKVSWHFPEGEKCPNLDTAKAHLIAIMKWLKENNLLSDEGKEIFELGIDSDFSLTSSMLTEKGNEIIKKGYTEWLKKIDYQSDVDLRFWDEILNEIQKSYKNK